MVYCVELSLGCKGLGCTDALLTMESYISHLDFSAAFDRVTHSGLLFKLESIGVGGSVLSICRECLSDCSRESWLTVLRVSGSQSFQACHREVCWVLFYLFYIPAKCLNWLRTDYLPMQMTPHYWQLIVHKPADRLLIPQVLGIRLAVSIL